jgi:hypothetical protein
MRLLATVLCTLLTTGLAYAQVDSVPTSQLRAHFAGTDVRRGANIWFFSTVRVSGLGENQTKIFFRNSRIRFRANGTQYEIAGPNGSITFSPVAERPGTTYDNVRKEFHTAVSLDFTGRAFLAGIRHIVPDSIGLSSLVGEVIWEGEFFSNAEGVRITWQWEARAFDGGFANYEHIFIGATDSTESCAIPVAIFPISHCMLIGEENGPYLLLARSGTSLVVPVLGVPPKPPTAIARVTSPTDVGAPVQLDGSRSLSATGRPLRLAWSFLSTPDGKIPILTDKNTATPIFVPKREGEYRLQLVVNDAGARSAPSTVRFWADRVRWSDGTFSMPGSVLLFWGYGDILLVQSGHLQALSRNGIRPSISRRGDLVAWVTSVPDESARVVPLEVSVDSWEYLETPRRSALAIYSVANQRTTTFPFGRSKIKISDNYEAVKDIAISPDGRRVAFIGCLTACHKESGIFLLEIATGNITPLFATSAGQWDSATSRYVGGNWAQHPSWSPDGTKLAFQLNQEIAILDLEPREVKIIANGTNPSWSPVGDWIAYFQEYGKRCVLIRPDGTGQKIIKKYDGIIPKIFAPWVGFEGSPIWSPDGKRLLFTVYLGETLRLKPVTKVVLLDLATGESKRMRKNALRIAGWASHQSK